MPDDASQSDWRTLFDTHATGLILFARQWCKTHADAEDVVHDVFVERWRQARQANDPAAYLYICVRHGALDQRRALARRLSREEHAGRVRREQQRESMFDGRLTDGGQTTLIETQLDKLPTDQREVLVLKIWGELTFAQIAEVLGASPNTIASRYRYALATLRQLMPQEVMT